MFARLKQSFRELSRSPPGRRFIDHYHRQCRRRDHGLRWKSALWILLGATMVLAGFVFSLPPGMPGFLLWAPGLGLIASQIKSVAIALDRLECTLRSLSRRDQC